MDAPVMIQLGIIFTLVIIHSYYYFRKKKEFNIEFLFFIISAILSGGAIYAGVMWIMKPFNVITDESVYNSPLYNVLVGLVLLLFSVIAVKNEIQKITSSKGYRR